MIKQKKIKNLRGSILAYSLIILSVMFVIAGSMSTITVLQRNSASSFQASVQSFQTADNGVQQAIKKINSALWTTPNGTIKDAFGVAACSNGVVANNTELSPGTSYDLSFYTKNGTQITDCDITKIDLITNIKSVGSYKNTVRAVSVEVSACPKGIPDRYDSSIKYDAINAGDGNCWLDRNLGVKVDPKTLTGPYDPNGFGWYFQWGRSGADGHQDYTKAPGSTTTNVLSATDTPADGKFITVLTSPTDWRLGQNNNLWQGGNNDNNPCPDGFRVPSTAEWQNLLTSKDPLLNNNLKAGNIPLFASSLRITSAPGRRESGGMVDDTFHNSDYIYWSRDTNGTNAKTLFFNGAASNQNDDFRAAGRPVRCIKE